MEVNGYQNSLVPNILQNIFFRVSLKGLHNIECEYMTFYFWVQIE